MSNRSRATFLGIPILLAACARTPPPNVVLVVVDTLRADHVGCYGYGRPTTPHIDRLAAQADRYARCRSTGPWTVPSHASLFTGLYAFEHGADTLRTKDGRIIDTRILVDQHVTLAEALAAAGYRTGAFVANKVYLGEKLGFAQGFGTYVADRAPSEELASRAAEWIGRDPSAPFFLFVNLLDCHRPYNVSPLPEARAGELPAPPPDRPGELLDRLVEAVMSELSPPPAELRDAVIAQYDTGIAHADLAIAALREELERRGLFDGTLFVVTADHGEYFGEHALVEHSKDVYEEALHVPLIVKRPGQRSGAVREEPISLADVPGLLFQELPRGLRERHGAGFPAPSAARPPLAEVHFARPHELAAPWGKRFLRERAVLYAGRYKLIVSSDEANELYDLAVDPGESRNLFAHEPELAARLGRALRQRLAAGPAAPSAEGVVELTPEEIEELRALGYL